jgi:ectonucleotide pyrophosphatase/phosphodiesterase family protein 1/3
MEESDRPSLITLYFNNPDGVNHKQGMHSKVLNLSLDAIDSTVDYLMNQLFLNDLLGCVNIVIVSDHGKRK